MGHRWQPKQQSNARDASSDDGAVAPDGTTQRGGELQAFGGVGGCHLVPLRRADATLPAGRPQEDSGIGPSTRLRSLRPCGSVRTWGQQQDGERRNRHIPSEGLSEARTTPTARLGPAVGCGGRQVIKDTALGGPTSRQAVPVLTITDDDQSTPARARLRSPSGADHLNGRGAIADGRQCRSRSLSIPGTGMCERSVSPSAER